MKKLISIFILSTLLLTVKAQQQEGLYFQCLEGSVWSSDEFLFDSSLFTTEYISLYLIKRKTDSVNFSSNIWMFSNEKVVVVLKNDTILQVEYKINNDKRDITFKDKQDSVTFQYNSVSNGNYVGLFRDKYIQIVGEAQNSKDGAILISNGNIYLIDKKQKWKDRYLGKMIRVKAQIIREEYMTKSDLGYDSGLVKQGRLGRTTVVKIKGKSEIIQ